MKKRILLCIACLLLLAVLPLTALAEEAPERLTMEQLEQLREEGKATYILSDQGYVTWLQGQFYDGKVEGEEGVLGAVERTRDLLGLDEEAQFVKGIAWKLGNGYTYYTIRQFSGGTSVENAIIKVIADPEGKAVAIASSVIPGLGSNLEFMISPEEALETAKAHLAEKQPDTAYTFYPDATSKTIVDNQATLNAVYIVYTNNPNMTNEEEDRQYLAHYVVSNGEYLYSVPVHSIEDETDQAAGDYSILEGKQETTYTGEVTLCDGSTKEITVPVLYDEAAGLYYLADAQRKIAVMDAASFVFQDTIAPRSSADNTLWDSNDLITYANYIQVYDYYASIGVLSPNGLDVPIAILSDYRDADGMQMDNACYAGIASGWHIFGSSPLNVYGECVDVLGHEYTHGFTMANMTNINYCGETGAINEAYSDILGNIIEVLSGNTEDTTWLMAEHSTEAIRSCSDPNSFQQPSFVGDQYYRAMDVEPQFYNDNGGVHANNSLLTSVAVDLEKAGMTLEEQLELWAYAACATTPLSGFEELLSMLQFTCDTVEMSQWKQPIADAFASRGLIGGMGEEIPYAEGCGILNFETVQTEELSTAVVYLLDPETKESITRKPYWPDGNGTFLSQYPAGEYLVLVRAFNAEGAPVGIIYTESGWVITEDIGLGAQTTADISAAVPVAIQAGATTTLEPMAF